MRLDLIFTIRDLYINSNLNTLTKFSSSRRSTEFKDILPMEHLSNDDGGHPNPRENSHKYYDKKGYPLLSLKESQWKLTQQNDQNFPGKLL